MEFLVKTRKIGGSIVTTIPKPVVEKEGIRGNEFVKLDIKKVKKSFFGKLKGIGPFTEKDELNIE